MSILCYSSLWATLRGGACGRGKECCSRCFIAKSLTGVLPSCQHSPHPYHLSSKAAVGNTTAGLVVTCLEAIAQELLLVWFVTDKVLIETVPLLCTVIITINSSVLSAHFQELYWPISESAPAIYNLCRERWWGSSHGQAGFDSQSFHWF